MIDYLKGGDEAYKAWSVYKKSKPHETRSLVDFVAGWNAAKSPNQPIAGIRIPNRKEDKDVNPSQKRPQSPHRPPQR